MMKTITVTNQKGGVGKTTTSHTLSAGLAQKGFKVLAIDADPQMNMTYTSGIDLDSISIDLYDLFRRQNYSLQAVRSTGAGFDIIPGSLSLAGADMEFTSAGREYILKEALEPLKEEYDFCIIDTPPTLGILTVNALTASDEIIVPMGADVYSLQGLSQLHGLIMNVKKYCNPHLKIEGLLLTKYNKRAIISKQLRKSLEDVAIQLETKVFSTEIREAVAVRESQFLQVDIFSHYPKSNVAEDYQSFINEFLKGERNNG